MEASRRTYIMLGSLILVSIGVVAFFMSAGSDELGIVDTKAAKVDVTANPGGDASPQMQRMLNTDNATKADAARKEGTSFMAGVTSSETGTNANADIDSILKDVNGVNTSGKGMLAGVDNYNNDNSQGSQNQSGSSKIDMQGNFSRAGGNTSNDSTQAQARLDSAQMRVLAQKMERIVDDISEELNISGPQVTVFAVEKKETDTGSDKSGKKPEAVKAKVVSPGDILYGINEVSLNSDSPGPVLVSIPTGKLKGARLMGGFERREEHLVVRFQSLVLAEKTYGIEAYAVDPATSSVAVSSDVDNHYFSRWAGLLAGSFIAGMGQAVSQSGSTTVSDLGTGSVQQNPTLTMEQQGLVALGEVGQELSGHLRKNLDRPPTVTLDAGTAIGILIVQAK